VNANTVKNTARPIFPFTAIVGQEEMKLALALNVIDPKIGGVIIMVTKLNKASSKLPF